MKISGIAASAHADISGHYLLANAVDCTRRVPLHREHGSTPIGEVTHMMYLNTDLYITAEVDDEAAIRGLDFLSIAGKPLQREQRGDVWHVTKFLCTEISVVAQPANSHCAILSRRPSDPFRALHLTRMRQLDLFKQAIEVVARGLPLLVRS